MFAASRGACAKPTRLAGDHHSIAHPEPFEISKREFVKLLRTRKGHIKPLLLNQEFLAGVGNIYVDESLWLARIHPLREASTLTDEEAGALFTAIRRVLKKARCQVSSATPRRFLNTSVAFKYPRIFLGLPLISSTASCNSLSVTVLKS